MKIVIRYSCQSRVKIQVYCPDLVCNAMYGKDLSIGTSYQPEARGLRVKWKEQEDKGMQGEIIKMVHHNLTGTLSQTLKGWPDLACFKTGLETFLTSLIYPSVSLLSVF